MKWNLKGRKFIFAIIFLLDRSRTRPEHKILDTFTIYYIRHEIAKFYILFVHFLVAVFFVHFLIEWNFLFWKWLRMEGYPTRVVEEQIPKSLQNSVPIKSRNKNTNHIKPSFPSNAVIIITCWSFYRHMRWFVTLNWNKWLWMMDVESWKQVDWNKY